jgi:hypothetical protein
MATLALVPGQSHRGIEAFQPSSDVHTSSNNPALRGDEYGANYQLSWDALIELPSRPGSLGVLWVGSGSIGGGDP